MSTGREDPRDSKVVRLRVDEAASLAQRLARATLPGPDGGEQVDPSAVVAQAVTWEPARWPHGEMGDLSVHEFLADFDALVAVIGAARRAMPQARQTAGSPTRRDHEIALGVLLASTAQDPVIRGLKDLRKVSSHSVHGRVTAKRWREDLDRRAPLLRAAWRDLTTVVADDPRLAS